VADVDLAIAVVIAAVVIIVVVVVIVVAIVTAAVVVVVVIIAIAVVVVVVIAAIVRNPDVLHAECYRACGSATVGIRRLGGKCVRTGLGWREHRVLDGLAAQLGSWAAPEIGASTTCSSDVQVSSLRSVADVHIRRDTACKRAVAWSDRDSAGRLRA